MMINYDYAKIINQAKLSNTEQAHFNKSNQAPSTVKPSTDKLTLSNAALAKMSGENHQEIVPTYVNPKTARSLLAANQSGKNVEQNQSEDKKFSDMMLSILDKRLGIDRDKLAELAAMMEEISKNENMTPEEKQKAMEQIEKMREELIKESIEMKNVAKQTFPSKNDAINTN